MQKTTYTTVYGNHKRKIRIAERMISLTLAALFAGTLSGCDGNGIKSDSDSIGDAGDIESTADVGTLDFDLSLPTDLSVCASGGIVYTCADDMITFFDSEKGISMPLCGKPECDHMSEYCNAYVGGGCYALSVYDGKLYWVSDLDAYGTQATVMRCRLDGTERETVTVFDTHSNENAPLFGAVTADRTMFIHRGYLYVCGAGVSSDGGSSVSVISVSLADGSVNMLFSSDAGGRYAAKPLKDELYVMISSVSGRDLSNFIWGAEHLEAHRIDLKTGMSELVFSFDSDEENVSYECWDFMPVDDDGIYFERTHEYEKNKVTGDYTSEASKLKYSFSSGELEVAIPKLDADGHSDFFDVAFMRNVIAGHWGGVTYLFDYSGEYVGYAEHIANATEAAYSDGKYVYYADRTLGGGQSSDSITFSSSPVKNVR